MIIDGKEIAEKILTHLSGDVTHQKEKGVTPILAVILIGNDPSSESYVKQKEKTAQKIGADLHIIRYGQTVTKHEIQEKIIELNTDPKIHGIIIQRPIPKHIQDETLLNSINPEKDVDGFVPGSPFDVPVAKAITHILESIPNIELKKKHIVVIGRGETAGKPIACYFLVNGYSLSVIHSETKPEERKELLKQADIIISCVGKPNTVLSDEIQRGVILISVGIHRGQDEKLHGDYDEPSIASIASYYTPTPGGVGPINVACLMENLVKAAMK